MFCVAKFEIYKWKVYIITGACMKLYICVKIKEKITIESRRSTFWDILILKVQKDIIYYMRHWYKDRFLSGIKAISNICESEIKKLCKMWMSCMESVSFKYLKIWQLLYWRSGKKTLTQLNKKNVDKNIHNFNIIFGVFVGSISVLFTNRFCPWPKRNLYKFFRTKWKICSFLTLKICLLLPIK